MNSARPASAGKATCRTWATTRAVTIRRWRYPTRARRVRVPAATTRSAVSTRSEEHTSELQSLMRISYAVFCLKKKNTTNYKTPKTKQDYNKIQHNKQSHHEA